jgi:microcystin-dependent protein
MTEPFLGEVQIFGFNFPPYQWALCNGSTLSIQQNTALFSLIGTQYGGNGTSSFQLPNLAARAACSQGTGLGLTPRTMGETFGEASYTLNITEMPQHSHVLNAFVGGADLPAPAAGSALSQSRSVTAYLGGATPPQPNTTLLPTVIGTAGGSQPHENRQPLLALNFCISMGGVFPAFN